MKFGINLPTSGPLANVEAIERVAVAADELGFDTIWAATDHLHRSSADAEHHFPAGAYEIWGSERPITPDLFEVLTTLGYVAAVTKRARIGTNILVLPLRNPFWVAKEAATLDRLSGGRMILGVGQGGGPFIRQELAAMGQSDQVDQPWLRGVTEEYIDVIRTVWREPVSDYSGKFASGRGGVIYPKPASEDGIPIWYGGASKYARRLVGRQLDGWISALLTSEEMARGVAEMREVASEAGRDPDAIDVAFLTWGAIGSSAAEARSKAELTLRKMWWHISRQGKEVALDPKTVEKAYWNEEANPERVWGGSFTGDAAEIVEKAERYREAGVTEVSMCFISPSLDQLIEDLQDFQENVASRLREAPAATEAVQAT